MEKTSLQSLISPKEKNQKKNKQIGGCEYCNSFFVVLLFYLFGFIEVVLSCNTTTNKEQIAKQNLFQRNLKLFILPIETLKYTCPYLCLLQYMNCNEYTYCIFYSEFTYMYLARLYDRKRDKRRIFSPNLQIQKK